MADGVGKGFWHSRQLSLNRVFDMSTPYMRKGCSGGKRGKTGGGIGKKKKRLMKIVATTSFASSLPPERRLLEQRTVVPNERLMKIVATMSLQAVECRF